MRDVALYYPYVHVRDDAWLKAAALYWPKIARLVPDGYPVADSEVARKLSGELDFILGINPEPYAHGLRAEFSDFIKENRAALQKRYYLPHSPIPGQPYESWKDAAGTISKSLFEKGPGRDTDFGAFDDCFPVSLPLLPFVTAIARLQQRQPVPQGRARSGLAWLSMDGPDTRDLRDQLFRTGLGRPAGAEWVVIAPDLAALYIAALAERVAAANDLAVVTDKPDAHGILGGWDVRTTAQALIGRSNPSEPAHGTDQVSAMYAAVAIQAVLPARIGDVPVDKIIEARRKLATEFNSFHEHLNSISDRLTELGPIQDPSVLQARLELMVGRDLRRPTEDLEEKLRQLHLEPARAVLGLKSLALPAAVAAAASAAAIPAGTAIPVGVAEGGLVAALFISTTLDARAKKRQTMKSSPAGYLLGLQNRLTPKGVVERLRQTMSRASQPPALR